MYGMMMFTPPILSDASRLNMVRNTSYDQEPFMFLTD